MQRRFKQTYPLRDRIASFARKVREKASQLPSGKEQDDLLRWPIWRPIRMIRPIPGLQ
jgi:hypothetical protein